MKTKLQIAADVLGAMLVVALLYMTVTLLTL